MLYILGAKATKEAKKDEKNDSSCGKRTNVELKTVFKAFQVSALVAQQKKGYSSGTYMQGVPQHRLEKHDLGKYNYNWRQPMEVAKPNVSFVSMAAPIFPGIISEVAQHCATCGVSSWAVKRLRSSMPTTVDEGVAMYQTALEDDNQVALKSVLTYGTDWVEKFLPVDDTKMTGWFAHLLGLRALDKVSGDNRGLDFYVLSVRQTAGASMGMPYVAMNEQAAKFGVNKPEFQPLGQLFLEKTVEIVYNILHMDSKEFAKWFKQDISSNIAFYVTLMKRKNDIYSRSKVESGVRVYYVFGAHTNTALQLLFQGYLDAKLNCLEDQNSCCSLGTTYFGKGDDKTYQKLNSGIGCFIDEKDIKMNQVIYSDDVWAKLFLTKDGQTREYTFEPDIRRADMNFGKGVVTFDRSRIDRKIKLLVSDPTQLAELLAISRNMNLFSLFTHFGGFVMTGGRLIVRKMRGLDSGGKLTSHYGTTANVLGWRAISPELVESLRNLLETRSLSQVQDKEISRVITDSPGQTFLDCRFKGPVPVTRITDKTVHVGTFLGMRFRKDQKCVKAYMPALKWAQHLCQPRRSPHKNKGAYSKARVTGLAILAVRGLNKEECDKKWNLVTDCYLSLNTQTNVDQVEQEIRGTIPQFGDIVPVLQAIGGRLPSRRCLEVLWEQGSEAFRKMMVEDPNPYFSLDNEQCAEAPKIELPSMEDDLSEGEEEDVTSPIETKLEKKTIVREQLDEDEDLNLDIGLKTKDNQISPNKPQLANINTLKHDKKKRAAHKLKVKRLEEKEIRKAQKANSRALNRSAKPGGRSRHGTSGRQEEDYFDEFEEPEFENDEDGEDDNDYNDLDEAQAQYEQQKEAKSQSQRAYETARLPRENPHKSKSKNTKKKWKKRR
jgi:hypothetical protein